MDLKKIKNTLLTLLIILNLSLLALYIYQDQQSKPYKIGPEERQDLVRRLEEKNISLEVPIPKGGKKLSPLIVKYEEESPDNINQRYFGGQGQIRGQREATRITGQQGEVNIINSRRIIYENLEEIQQEENTQDREELARTFLEERGYVVDNLRLTKNILEDPEEDNYLVEFVKTYQDHPVETSYTRIRIRGDRVITLDRLWINVIEEEGNKIEIEPATKALYSLLSREELEGKTINSIELCYYFNPEEQGILEDNTRAERGRAIPAWRIGFTDGDKLVVDNY